MEATMTIQGDTWDILSLRLYGTEFYCDELIKANINERERVVFPAGIILNVPDIDTEADENNEDLPPWKRTAGDE